MRSHKIQSTQMYELGMFLKALRLDLGWSIRAAARKASITAPHLSKVESGVGIQSIGVPVLVSIASAYRVPVSTILKEAGFLPSAEERDGLPDFATYLRRKYDYSPQVIRDMEMAKEVVDRKYGGKP